jgi:hypothetical protein
MSSNAEPEMNINDHEAPPWWRTRSGLVLCGFLLIAGFYLLIEHTAHVFGVLPFLLILACPLMHLFMHHGHGGHDATPAATQPPVSRGNGDAP